MAQAFVSTTKNSYRWNVQEKARPIRQETFYEDCYGKNVDWYTPSDLNVKTEQFDKVKAAVKQLQKKRMSTTTYKMDYCRDWRSSQAVGRNGLVHSYENQLLQSFKSLYLEKSGKVLPTIASQRILGFLTPSRMYTPTSVYQNDYGKLGFKRLGKM